MADDMQHQHADTAGGRASAMSPMHAHDCSTVAHASATASTMQPQSEPGRTLNSMTCGCLRMR
eukprot:365122-Chlamydomonas_euryale.AAC.45